MLDFKKLQDNEKKLFIEKVERMTKFLLLIKKLDILFIDLFELKPINKKEKK